MPYSEKSPAVSTVLVKFLGLSNVNNTVMNTVPVMSSGVAKNALPGNIVSEWGKNSHGFFK